MWDFSLGNKSYEYKWKKYKSFGKFKYLFSYDYSPLLQDTEWICSVKFPEPKNVYVELLKREHDKN